MSSSSIFAIITAVIIIIGRLINRSADKMQNNDSTTESFDAEHDFSGEEAIPARETKHKPHSFDHIIDDEPDPLAKAIREHIITTREMAIEAQQNRHARNIEGGIAQNRPQFESKPMRGEGTTPQVRKPKPQPKKAKPAYQPTTAKPQNQNASIASANESSEICEEFDLAKAVIYAEILNPKFDQ